MQTFNEFVNSDKPILFLNFDYDVNDLQKNTTNLQTYLTDVLKNCLFYKFKEVYWFKNGLFVGDKNLKDFGLIFFGAIGKSIELATTIYSYCENYKIPFLSYGSTIEKHCKMLQTEKLANIGIKIPKTLIGCANVIDVDKAVEFLKFPIVSKITNGSQGKGVEIHQDLKSLENCLKDFKDTTVILQEFIPNKCDYRVFFIGDEHILSMKRSTQSNDFRNNISLGGKGEKIDLDFKQIDMAKNAHSCMNFFVSGVDLIQSDATKEWYCLEVNSAPQFGMWDVPKILDVFIKYIKNNRI
jgi:RimK family alpha-L-glutamate ligase